LNHVCLICDVFHPSKASTSQLFTQLLSALAADGLRFIVVTNRLPRAVRLVQNADALPPGIDVAAVGLPLAVGASVPMRLLQNVCFVLTASVRLLCVRADRFWASTNPPFAPIWVAAIAAVRRRPFDAIVHDVYPEGLVAVGYLQEQALLAALWHRLNRWAYQRAARVVVLGRDMADLMRDVYDVPPDRLVMFPNWSPFNQSQPPRLPDSRLARELRLEDKFVVQYSGNMGLWHDIDTIVEAARILADDPRIHFLMIGGGRRRQPAEGLGRRLGLMNITWADSRPRGELSDSLACSSVAIISQRDQLVGIAVPCKLYGILASGRAVIAAVPERSEVATVVREEGCGVVVPPSDPAALAAAIRCLVDDSHATTEMGRLAFVAYRSKYSMEAAISRFWRTWMPTSRAD
jgi:colanic acid biosynthesis glycosyl transferase WcaI